MDTNVCVWCGTTESLARHHVQNRKASILSYNEFRFGIFRGMFPLKKPSTYKEIMNKMGCTYKEAGEIHRKMKAENSKKGKDNWQKFINDIELQKKIVKKYENYRKPLLDKYNEFNSEDIIILCKKCHFAFHHEMDLCPKCKKRYKKMSYSTCYDCLPDERRRKIEKDKAIMAEIERKDQVFDEWCDEFYSATPERQKEMLKEQDGIMMHEDSLKE